MEYDEEDHSKRKTVHDFFESLSAFDDEKMFVHAFVNLFLCENLIGVDAIIFKYESYYMHLKFNLSHILEKY